MTDVPPEEPEEPTGPGRGAFPAPASSSWRYRMIMAAAVAVAVGALVLGVRATNTDGEATVLVNGRPGVVEHVYPRNGAEALRQAEIGIDLAGGYEGALALNGTPIPTEELRLVPEQNQVFFAPAEGRTFRTLPSGSSCVTATVWKSSEGRGANDLTYQWCFDVT